jgi:hypothetical protein
LLPWCLFLLLVKIAAERIELRRPEKFVTPDPRRGLLHRRRFELATHDSPLLRAGNQARGLEHRQMLHEAWQRHVVRLGKVAHRDLDSVRPGEARQHVATGGIGQRREDEVEARILFVNHVV